MNMLQSSADVVNTYYGWAGDAVINSKTCTWRLCWLKPLEQWRCGGHTHVVGSGDVVDT